MKETPKQAGYKWVQKSKQFGNKAHIFLNEHTRKMEVFYCNKNHASWGLIYKNIHLEFAHIIP